MSENGKVLTMRRRLQDLLLEATHEFDIAEITRLYYELYPDERPAAGVAAVSPSEPQDDEHDSDGLWLAGVTDCCYSTLHKYLTIDGNTEMPVGTIVQCSVSDSPDHRLIKQVDGWHAAAPAVPPEPTPVGEYCVSAIEELARAMWIFEGDNNPTWEECIRTDASVVYQYRNLAEFVIKRVGRDRAANHRGEPTK